ncbi:MAG: DUF2782 domain-containing protein [Betaproteobacteria bacterium]
MLARLLASVLFAASLAGTAGAQKPIPPDLQPLPEPPPMAVGDPELEPQVTIRKAGADTVEEIRFGGRLVMIKVTPARGVPYVLTDPKGDGSFSQRRDSLETPISVPMWVLFTF